MHELKEFSQQRVMFNLSVLNTSQFDQSNVHSNLTSLNASNGGLNQGDSTSSSVKVNLPKMQLPCFDGNIQQWTEFWKMF